MQTIKFPLVLRPLCCAVLFAAVALAGNSAQAQLFGQDRFFNAQREANTVTLASQTLSEIMAIPASGIPVALLKDAEAVAIVPRVIKAGFVIGGRHGEGVLLLRNAAGNWGNPLFVSLTGGSIGWQIGVQSTDVVLVFKTRKSLDGFLTGRKFTLGADASIAAGPVGREAQAGTDFKLESEIYSYSRSRGLFAGASLEGSVMEINNREDAGYYGQPQATITNIVEGQNINVPADAIKLKEQLTATTGAADLPLVPVYPLQSQPQRQPQRPLGPTGDGFQEY